jgi:sterol desaturase/sphingolipid hydroxylase (fatty acid hydroxylase superfamily)
MQSFAAPRKYSVRARFIQWKHMRLFNKRNTNRNHPTPQQTHRSPRWLNTTIGALLALASIGGATDLAGNARWPWPNDALQDPIRVQLLVSFLLACMLCFALVQIIKAHPHREEQFDD